MRVTKIGTVTLASSNVTAKIVNDRRGNDRQPVGLDGGDGVPELIAARLGLKTIEVECTVIPGKAFETAIATLLGAIYGQEGATLDITGELDLDTNGDGQTDTTVTIMSEALLGTHRWKPEDKKAVMIPLIIADPDWEGATQTDGPASISASPTTRALNNTGLATTYPLVKLGWTVQRGTGSATTTLGWRFTRTQPITNNGPDPWIDELIAIDIGDSAALVSAKAQADGDDLRVHWRGEELPRELLGWDQTQTFVVVALTLEAGDTANLEIVYGNNAATNPAKLTNYQSIYGLDRYTPVNLDSESGSANAGTTTTLTDTDKAWTPDRFLGGIILLLLGTGAATHAARRISDNTATVITVDRPWGTAPDGTTSYLIYMGGWLRLGGGVASATPTVLTDSSGTYNADELIGGILTIVAGTGNGATEYPITDNDATTITTSGTLPTLDTTSRYLVRRHGYWQYRTQQVATLQSTQWGGWRLTAREESPELALFRQDGVPMAWDITTYLANDDDYNQIRASRIDTGGSVFRWLPIFNATRRQSSSRAMTDKKLGDSVVLFSAMRVTAHRVSYQMQNQNGVGQFVVAVRSQGGESWTEWHTYAGTHAALTNRSAVYMNYSAAPPKEILHTIVPADGIAIDPTKKKSDQINVRWNDILQVWVDQTYVSFGALTAETATYDLQVKLQIGTTHRIVVGGPDHWWHPASTVKLAIDCETGEIYSFSGTIDGAVSSPVNVPWAAVVEELVATIEGGTDWVRSDAWFPLAVGSTNVDFTETAIGTIQSYITWLKRYIV